MNVIYIDVLVIINIYVGYFLLKSTQKILSVSVTRLRMIIGCIFSGVFSIIILFEFNIVELILIKSVMASSLCFVTFYRKNLKLYLKSIIAFIVVNFVFGGIMLALQQLLTQSSFSYKNGVCYFSITTLKLSIYTIVAYIIISIFDYIIKRRTTKEDVRCVTIKFNGREIMVDALVDSGNKLVDVFTGLPVLVCELMALEKFLSPKLFYYLKTKGGTLEDDITLLKSIRIIPINIVSGESSLMAFKPDEVISGNTSCNMLVAVTGSKLSDGSFNAIIGNL